MPRRLTSSERELWNKVAHTIEQRLGKAAQNRSEVSQLLPATTATKPKPQIENPRFAVPNFRVGETASNRSNGVAPTNTPKLDKKLERNLGRGKMNPEATLDLHGMTAEAAHGAVQQFVVQAHRRQKRLILIITGKGNRPSTYAMAHETQGVLRRAVPLWLHQGPLKSIVLEIRPAHIRHGGDGAYYVYLKRQRS